MTNVDDAVKSALRRAQSIRAAAERLAKKEHPDDYWPSLAGALTAWVEQLSLELALMESDIAARLRSNHGHGREQAQALAVSGPVGSIEGQWAPVQIYALGAGVTIARQGADLCRREGTIELEANGQVLVFDPLAARVTDGLVVPIERHVTAVWQTVEAVDEANGCNGLDGGVGHGSGKRGAQAVILSLPAGSGKTLIDKRLAAALGLRWVVDPWVPGHALVRDALHLTNERV